MSINDKIELTILQLAQRVKINAMGYEFVDLAKHIGEDTNYNNVFGVCKHVLNQQFISGQLYQTGIMMTGITQRGLSRLSQLSPPSESSNIR
jgi:hypothetical protein